MNKLRVGVLMGGTSSEREVSFNSGRTVCDHLDTTLYTIIPLFQRADGTLYRLPWHFLHRGKIADFEQRLATQAESLQWDDLQSIVDFVYIAMHGQYAEDGVLQGALETLQIPYLGSGVLASALGMDKLIQKDLLQQANLCVPACLAISPEQITHYDDHKNTILTSLANVHISFPLIVKPRKEGSSLGVRVIEKTEDLKDALIHASFVNPDHPQTVLIEEKIDGMEFSCVLLYDYANQTWMPLPPTEIEYRQGTQFFDYEQKYMPGKAIEHTPARCDAQLITKIQEACIATAHALEFTTIARIDGFLKADGTVVIVDPNSFSGLAPASFLFREAAQINLNHPQVINHLIKTELHHYAMLDTLNTHQTLSKKYAPKMRIAVLMGGDSNEREISLESGRNVVYKLSTDEYQVLPIFVSSTMQLYTMDQRLLVRSSTVEIERLVTPEMQVKWADLPRMADFVFIALHGGKGENGCVQGMLEMLRIPYNGSGVLTSALCMNKFKTTQVLKHKGFHVPQALLIDKQNWLANHDDVIKTITRTIGYPIIVKPHDDGCSTMVHKATTDDECHAALETIYKNDKDLALIEEFITGMELTVGVIGNDAPYALIPSQTIATKGILSIQEKFLPGAGENQTPAPLPQETIYSIRKIITDAYSALDCKGYSRIDCFYQSAQQSQNGHERVVIIEVNTLPALTPATCIFHQAAELDIKPRQFIKNIVDLGIEQHKHVQKNVQSPDLSTYL